MPPDEDEEEDYMSMVIEEPTQKETFTQRKRREQREVHVLEVDSSYTRTDCSIWNRPKPAPKSLPKPKEPQMKLAVAMKPLRPALWTPQTRGSR